MLNQIFHDNCFNILPTIPDKTVDMVLSDLPYNITSNKWDTAIDLTMLWQEYKRICKDNAAIVLTASQPFTSILVTSNINQFKHEWIWVKNRGSNFANTMREPFKEHESILVFANNKWTYNKQMQERSELGKDRAKYKINYTSKSENYRNFDGRLNQNISELRCPSSCQRFNVEVGLHPTQKPVELFRYLIRTYSNEDEVVLDTCIGSGTTAVACMRENRNFIGIEQEEKYYKVCLERINNERIQQI